MKLDKKRRMAAELLGVGVNRVWIDPSKQADVAVALTSEDIRKLIQRGVIQARPERGTSRARARERAKKRKKRKRVGPGSRKGAKKARTPRKRRWIQTVRPLRRRLKELKRSGLITTTQYRKLYRMIKGGAFKSKAHLETYLKEKGIVR
jgi:large subunit ribosomal protein L19e